MTASADEIRTFIDTPPATLNPRFTLDAAGQRINMLLFRALTSTDADLKTQPDLAESWRSFENGKVWKFEIKKNLIDHSKKAITAQDIALCLNEYIEGKPTSPLKASFHSWKSIDATGSTVTIRLSSADPFLPKNLSLFRFFRIKNEPTPCHEPTDKGQIIGSGEYRTIPFELNPEKKITFIPEDSLRPILIFEVVRDETTRLLKLLKGDADFIQNSFSPTKTDWLMKNHGDQFRLIEKGGVNVSYLAFNLNDPILKNLKVRKAIAASIDRAVIVRSKLRGFASIAGSFLAPELKESSQSQFSFDRTQAEKWLDEAGYPKDKNGIRFSIKYKTTPNKEGFETAQVIQEMLSHVGIHLDLEMVDTAVFFASIRKGNFQMFSSRWIGISDGSIYLRTLHSGNPDNRVKYADPEMDRWIDETIKEVDEEKRAKSLFLIQKKMGEDLPYLPLWFWTNALILKKDIVGLKPDELSLSGSYTPFSKLHRQAEK